MQNHVAGLLHGDKNSDSIRLEVGGREKVEKRVDRSIKHQPGSVIAKSALG